MFRPTLMAMLLFASAPGNATLLLEDDFSRYTASGLAPGGQAGALDSLLWCAIGASDGDSHFGALAAGDFARGESTGGVSTGGLYAFTLPGGSRALGLQATGTDFTPGALVRRAVNLTGEWLGELLLEAEIWILNDADRSTRVTLEAATGADLWHAVPDATLLTAAHADAAGWQRFAIVSALPLPLLAPGAELLLRLGFDDAAGTGARDEIALSALRVTAATAAASVHLAAPSTAWLLLAGAMLLARPLHRRNASASTR
jgi:hypothetical protein